MAEKPQPPKPNAGNPPVPQAKAKAENPNVESKAEKFRRLANRRVPKLLKLITHVGNLSTKGSYAYTDEQIDHMFGLIHEALRTARARFQGARDVEQKSIF